ncbi:MAG: hypothetical protein ACLRFR_00690 [Clostridia bacterium]
MSVVVTNKNGKKVTLVNPNEKAAKFAREMKTGLKFTNDGEYKRTKTGAIMNLNKAERAYRAGYLQHARESQIIWCKQNGVKSQSLANSKKYWHKQKQKQLNKSFKNYDKVYGK